MSKSQVLSSTDAARRESVGKLGEAISGPGHVLGQGPARFIAFEGLDGSGKSTLIRSLVQFLSSDSDDVAQSGLARAKVLCTREPGGTPLAEEIRNLLLRRGDEHPVATTELLLYAASRAQHVAHVIRPALERGEWVLCDRFAARSVAFQCFARGLSRHDVDMLNQFACGPTVPVLNVLLDVTVDETERRQAQRTLQSGQLIDRMESEKREFHERVRQGYLAQAQESPHVWLMLDGHLAPELILNQLISALRVKGLLPQPEGGGHSASKGDAL
jgi:dTMP kinase